MKQFFEKTLEQIVFENIETIEEKGFAKLYSNNYRQFRIPSGIIDILSWQVEEGILYAHIIELKRDIIDQSAYFQAVSYWETLFFETKKFFKDFNVDIILVGTNVSDNISQACMLSNLIKVYTYEYGYNGISFLDYTPTFNESKAHYINTETKEENNDLVTRLKSKIVFK